MTIGARVMEASAALYGREPERSLRPTVVAIDTTARKRYPGQRSNRARFSRFVEDNMRLITAVWLGVSSDACRLNIAHPKLDPNARDGTVGVEDVLYHIVRVELLREKGLTPDLFAVAPDAVNVELREGGRRLLCPRSLVEGCLAAVILAPENADKRTPEPAALYMRGKRYWVNRLWGRRDYFCREVLQTDPRNTALRGEAQA